MELELDRIAVGGIFVCLGGALVVAACSSSGSGGAKTCEQSGSFMASLSASQGHDTSGATCNCTIPSPLNVSVTWSSDGSATLNGEPCAAVCGASTQTCGSQKLPPTDTPAHSCAVNLFCCDAMGQSACPTGTFLDQVIFNADGQPPRVQVSAQDSNGCVCWYFSSN